MALGFRNDFSFVPKWLKNRLNKTVGAKILYSLRRPLDVMMQVALEGVQAAWPGFGTPTALGLIGFSRGIIRGENETDAGYAARLIPWLDDWANAGSSEILVRAIWSYLGNHPTVRIVDRSGNWVSIDGATGIITKTVDTAWNWDSVSNPENQPPNPAWSDMWIIVYPTEWPVTGLTLASLIGLWGSITTGTGHAVPRAPVGAIQALVKQWKGAHVFMVALIYSYDSTLFVPGSLGNPGNPDGTWGYWGKPSAGTYVPARTGAADGRVRYWIPFQGNGG